jgi:two-component system sensor histidine kinase TctE
VRLLEDLLGNLVDNALHYTPAGGHITIRCGADAAAATGSKSYLEVEDDGPGIPAAERVRVRERFYRLPGSTGHGCGLGLAIVDEISRLHEADLTIDAGANGRGTRIRVTFGARRQVTTSGNLSAPEHRIAPGIAPPARAPGIELRTASQLGGV